MKSTNALSQRQGRNIGPGRRLRFLGFRERRARFTLEKWETGLLSIELLDVPLDRDPYTSRQCARARRFAERQVMKALAA